MENIYENQKISGKIKSGLKNATIAYAALTSIGMLSYTLTGAITGHTSADLHLGKSKISRLEKAILKPVFDKFEIKTDLLDK